MKAHPPSPSPRVAALAAELGARGEAAFLVDDREVCFAHADDVTTASAGRVEVRSAVLALLLGVHEAFPGRAHLLARRRIWTTAVARVVDREVVRVGGSKVSFGVGAGQAGTTTAEPPSSSLVDVARALPAVIARVDEGAAQAGAWAGTFGATAPWSLDDAVGAARSLAARAGGDSSRGPRALRDRAVATIVLDDAGRPRGATVNVNGRNRMLHAEVCAVLAGFVRPGVTVVTSLKPCRMCAALLVEAAHGRLEVVYCADDPGRLARRTVLEGRRLERPPPGGLFSDGPPHGPTQRSGVERAPSRW